MICWGWLAGWAALELDVLVDHQHQLGHHQHLCHLVHAGGLVPDLGVLLLACLAVQLGMLGLSLHGLGTWHQHQGFQSSGVTWKVS